MFRLRGCDLDEPLACLELGAFLSGNLDGLTRAGVATCAGRTADYAEGTKTNEGDLFAFCHLFFDNVDIGIQSFASIYLGQTGFFSHSSN